MAAIDLDGYRAFKEDYQKAIEKANTARTYEGVGAYSALALAAATALAAAQGK